jgi:hypothetical protein
VSGHLARDSFVGIVDVNWLSHGANETEGLSMGKYIPAAGTVSVLPEDCNCFVWAQ